MASRCPDCGADLALVGRRHNCRPRQAAPIPSHVTSRDVYIESESRRVTPPVDPVTSRDTADRSGLLAERWRLLDRLAEIDATVGPMTAAERQRRRRARA